MDDIPDEALYDYSVVFYLEGVNKRFEYQVSKGTYDSIRETLEDDEVGNIVFAAYRPAEQIVVNSRFLQLAHFLWRPKRDGSPAEHHAEETDESGDHSSSPNARTDAVDLYFAGRERPVHLDASDPEEVFDLLLAMETEAFPRCSIVDSEGEEAVLDLRRLVCAELPLGLSDRGEARALAELEEEV